MTIGRANPLKLEQRTYNLAFALAEKLAFLIQGRFFGKEICNMLTNPILSLRALVQEQAAHS